MNILSRDPDELVHVELTDEERYTLVAGLAEWGGPASCTDAMAVAMGFADVPDLLAQGRRIRAELDARRPLSRWDWTRTLLATEIVFASAVIGSGLDWQTTTGSRDGRTIEVLRVLQRKLGKAGARVSIRCRDLSGANQGERPG